MINQASPKLRIVCSWYSSGNRQFGNDRLSSTAQKFAVREIVDPESERDNTLPSVEVFSEHMKKLRIRKDDIIVCYDMNGFSSVARTAWMLRYFGATHVRIMDGGLEKWKKEGRALHSGSYVPGDGLPEGEIADYAYSIVDPGFAVKIHQMHEIAKGLYNGSKDVQVVDLRPAARFNGLVDEPEGLRRGHITGAINIPVAMFSNPETWQLLPKPQL